MKKISIVLAFMCTLAACKNKSGLDTTKEIVPMSDTAIIYKNNYSTDVANNNQPGVLPANSVSTTIQPKTSNNVVTTHRTTTRTYRKKGWSKAAQGTGIGGVGGALTGAIVSKKKGKGALIGGVVGATGGYLIGRSKDKKDGRVR